MGSPAQERDFGQYRQVCEDAQRSGMPLIVWSCPRGEAIDTKGGTGSSCAVDYAARTVCFAAQLTGILAQYPSG